MSFWSNILLFMDRVNITIAAPAIIQEFGWDETQMGFVISAFFVGYVLFMIPGGVIADRFGAKRVLASAVAFWSLFTVLTPFLHRLSTLAACRFLVGIGQGLNFPCINNLIATHVPLADRAKVQGFVLSGITMGSVIALPLGLWIVQQWGWPAIFYIFGAVGALWLVPWLRLVPTAAPSEQNAAIPTPPPLIPWRLFFTHRSTLGLILSYYCHNYGSYFILAWLPMYLIKVHGFSMTEMGFGAALPAVAATLSMNLSGWYTDFLIQRGKTREYSLKLMLVTGMGLSALSMLSLVWTENALLAVVLLVLSSGSKGLATPAYWTLSMEMAPRHAGILSSIMNTSGNIAGVIAPVLSGFLIATTGGWELAIVVASVITLAGVGIAAVAVRAAQVYPARTAANQVIGRRSDVGGETSG